MLVDDAKIKISNPDKILFPESKIKKIQFVEYFRDIAQYALPFYKDRPISLERFPDGINGEVFFQKEIPEYYPDFFERVDIEDDGKVKPYGMINNAPSLVYLANMVCIIHLWTSKKQHLRKPDKIIWDLDPSNDSFKLVKTAAKLTKYVLGELGLKPYLKMTGSRGLHLVAAIKPELDVDDVVDFAKGVGELLARKLPKVFTIEFNKKKRGNRIFVDYLRNRYGQTAAAPFAVRALENAPVALPIKWELLEDEDLDPQQFTIFNSVDEMEKNGNPWDGMLKHPSDLNPAIKKLEGFLGK